MFERWLHRTARDGITIGDDLNRMGEVLVLVLEVEHDVPSLRHREDECAATEPVEVHAAVLVRQPTHELQLSGLAGGIGAEPSRIYPCARRLSLSPRGSEEQRARHEQRPPVWQRQVDWPSHIESP